MLKKSFILLAALCLSFITYAQDFIAASYNIRQRNTVDVDNMWNDRKVPLTNLIKYHGFDIFGIQEGFYDQVQDLKTLLPGFDYVGVGRDDGSHEGEHSAIYYNTKRFKAIKSGTFWLSATDTEHPNKGWDAALPRICTWVQLQEINSGKKFWYFNLHMDHVGVKAREKSSRLVVKKMKEFVKGELAILTGDFNVDQNNEIYNILQESDFIEDSFELAPTKFTWNGTFNAFDNNLWTDSRIDHVFVTPRIKVKHYAVLTESYRSAKENSEEVKKGDFPKELSFKQYETRLPSDHFPLVVKIKL